MILPDCFDGFPFWNVPGLFADLIVSDALWTLKGAVHPFGEFDVQALISPIDKVMVMKPWRSSRFVYPRLQPHPRIFMERAHGVLDGNHGMLKMRKGAVA